MNSPTPAGIQATSSGLATSTEKNSFRRAGQVPIDQEIQKSQAKKEETTKPRGRSPSEGLVDKTPKRKRSKSRGPSGGGLLSNLKAFAINQPENEQSSSEFVEQATESLATTTESDAMLTTKISKKIFKRKKVDRAIHGHDRETEGSSAKIMDEGTFDYTKSDACACSGIPRKAGENNLIFSKRTQTYKPYPNTRIESTTEFGRRCGEGYYGETSS